MELIYLTEEKCTYARVLKHLGLPLYIDLDKVLTWIFSDRFVGTKSSTSVEAFKYLGDYDLVYSLFRKEYGINLEKEEVDWWEFTSMFNELLCCENALTRRMGYRGYVVPSDTKGREEEVTFNLNQKLKYSYKPKKENIDKEMGKLFNSLSRMGGKK